MTSPSQACHLPMSVGGLVSFLVALTEAAKGGRLYFGSQIEGTQSVMAGKAWQQEC